MTKNDYINFLISAFKICKSYIKEGKREIFISEKKYNNLVFSIPSFKDIPEINIYSVSVSTSLYSKYNHLSGVNVLFFIVCLYLRIEKNNTGNYHEYKDYTDEKSKSYERIAKLKKNFFIYETLEKGFWYYPISELKSTKLFIFDLTKMNSNCNSKG